MTTGRINRVAIFQNPIVFYFYFQKMKNKIKNQVPIYKKKNEFFFLKSIFCFEHYLVSFITKTQVRILLFNNLLNFLTLPLVRQIFLIFFVL